MAYFSHNQPNVNIKRESDMDQRQTLTPGSSPPLAPAQALPGPSNVKREQRPDQYGIEQEQVDHQQRESSVDTMNPTTQMTSTTVTQTSMASGRYVQPQFPVNPSPASLNRMASKRLLEDDSMDQMQCGVSPANKRRRHESYSRGANSEASSSAIPRIKLDPSVNVEVPQMHRAPENDIMEICKTCTSGNLTQFEFERLTEIQTKIDWVFNHGAKSFDIRSEIQSRIPHQPPTAYGLIFKAEQNRRIGEL